MSSIYEKIDNRIETFLSTLKRFPFASFSALLITMIFLVLIDHHKYNDPNVIIASKVAFVASLGIVLFPALQLLNRSIIFPILGLVLISLYYYCLPHNIDKANDTIFIRHILFVIALFSMIIWAPFIGRKSNNDSFWQYAQAIIFGVIVAIFFSIIVYAGLAAALYAIEKLFHFDIDSVRYRQLGLIIFGVFGVNFFLSQIPKHPIFMQVRPYSAIKRIFSKNILAPIALVYFIILFTYTAKILITMSWPTGILSWIIVAFSFVAIVSFLFLTPYLKKSSLTQRLVWFAIFLQTIMLGMALWMRVEEYGITYNRYLLALFGLWLALMSLYFILFGKAQQKWLFFFASLFILFSQFGPYSAKAISQESQTARLIKLIETAHPRSEELEMKKKYEISDGINYINKQYGINAFEKIIPHILKKYKTTNEISAEKQQHDFPSFATKALGFNYVNYWDWQQSQNTRENREHYFYQDSLNNITNVHGYDYLISYQHYSNDEPSLYKKLNLSIEFKENFIEFHDANSSVKKFDLSSYAQKLLKTKADGNRGEIPEKLKSYVSEQDNIEIKIIFERISLLADGNVSDFSSQILLKK